MAKQTTKLSLRDRCAQLAAEFTDLAAAKVRQTKAANIMRQDKSYKFRLNQLVSMDARLGQIYPQPVTSPIFAWLLAFDMINPR